MSNRWDVGMQEDFNNMTSELGRSMNVYPRSDSLNYEGQEGSSSGTGSATEETVFLQELDTKHEMITSGELKVGDVRLTFRNDTVAEEEGYVYSDGNQYKILNFTKVRGMNNNSILYVKAFGKKVPGR